MLLLRFRWGKLYINLDVWATAVNICAPCLRGQAALGRKNLQKVGARHAWLNALALLQDVGNLLREIFINAAVGERRRGK